MSTPFLRPRPGIMDIAPYVGGESSLKGRDTIIKLASNEGAFGPSPKALAAVVDASTAMHRYPDGGATAFREAIAKRFALPMDRLVCGAGSDEIISLLCYTYAGPGDEVLYSAHGFLMYRISALAAGATPVSAPETDLKTDVDNLLAAVTDKTRIVFIANPNNPTGTYLSAAEVQRLRAGLPDRVLLVIDAAYAEFVARDDYTPGFELVDQGQNTVMTRTFSKLFALGGLRLGWAYLPSEVADVLNRVRGPFNVSSLAQAAGIAALEDTAFTQQAFEHNLAWIAKTQDALSAIGLATTDSVGNFVLARFTGENGKTAPAADDFLRENGIIVRRMEAYGLGDSLRITIGTEAQMQQCLDVLQQFMK